MNTMRIGMFYVEVCRCGAVLKSIQVTPYNAVQVAKFNQNAARCGRDVEHVTEDYFAAHEVCTCDADSAPCVVCGRPVTTGYVCRNCEVE